MSARPCRGLNANVCVAEGCYGEACQPEPLTGVTVFGCRCGATISTADYPRFADYEKARKDHRDACPMRFDKPWPFDRLPSLRRTKTTSEPGPAMVGESGSEVTDADPSARLPRTVRQAARNGARAAVQVVFPSAPRWVRRVAREGLA